MPSDNVTYMFQSVIKQQIRWYRSKQASFQCPPADTTEVLCSATFSERLQPQTLVVLRIAASVAYVVRDVDRHVRFCGVLIAWLVVVCRWHGKFNLVLIAVWVWSTEIVSRSHWKAIRSSETYGGLWKNIGGMLGRDNGYTYDIIRNIGHVHVVRDVFWAVCNTWDNCMRTLRPPEQEELVIYLMHEHPQETHKYCCDTCASMNCCATCTECLVWNVLTFCSL